MQPHKELMHKKKGLICVPATDTRFKSSPYWATLTIRAQQPGRQQGAGPKPCSLAGDNNHSSRNIFMHAPSVTASQNHTGRTPQLNQLSVQQSPRSNQPELGRGRGEHHVKLPVRDQSPFLNQQGIHCWRLSNRVLQMQTLFSLHKTFFLPWTFGKHGDW